MLLDPGPAAYLLYVEKLVRSWGLSPKDIDRGLDFAKSWTKWLAHKSISASGIASKNYLQVPS